MDILQELVQSLGKEELKSYKLYVKRTHNFNNRIDIDLFDSIKKFPNESDKFHFNKIYHIGKPDTKYYRLKNKIVDDIGTVLSNLNHRKPEFDVLYLIGLAKIFYSKQKYSLAIHFLKLAERRAIEKELYALLETVYEQLVKIYIQNSIDDPGKIISKRNENTKRLLLLQELENNLAVLSYEVKSTQNLTSKKQISTWLKHTLNNTLKLSYVKNSTQLRIKIFQNISRLMLLLKDYSSLESYLKSCLAEFEKDLVFNKSNHDIKLQLLVYLCNTSYMLNKNQQSINYATVLHKELFEYNKDFYSDFIFYYYNILVNNYSKTSQLKAIEILEEAKNVSDIVNTPNQYFYVLSNLAILFFDLKKHKQAGKYFSQIYVSNSYKTFDKSFIVKLHTFELINKLEAQEYESCQKLFQQLVKLINDVREKDSIKIDIAIIDIMEKYLIQTEFKWRSLKPSIQKFIEKFNDSKNDTGLINYTQWIETKI